MNALSPSETFNFVPYLGRPWQSGGRGPEAFDCWGFVRWVQFHDFKRPPLPDYPIAPELRPQVRAEIQNALNGQEWQRLAGPEDRCAVALYRNPKVCGHVGVFVATDGGIILHALERFGVIATPLRSLEAHGWSRAIFYNHKSW